MINLHQTLWGVFLIISSLFFSVSLRLLSESSILFFSPFFFCLFLTAYHFPSSFQFERQRILIGNNNQFPTRYSFVKKVKKKRSIVKQIVQIRTEKRTFIRIKHIQKRRTKKSTARRIEM